MDSFLKFPQDGVSPKYSYWDWLRRAQAIFAATGDGPLGLLGLTMSNEDFVAFQVHRAPPLAVGAVAPAAPPPFTLLERPSRDFRMYSPLPAAARAAEAQRAHDAIMIVQFKLDHDDYNRQAGHVSQLRARLMASIDPKAEQAAANAVIGFSFMNIAEIFSCMARKYAHLDSGEVAILERSLDVKWTTGLIVDFIATHRHVHEMLRINGQSMSVSAQILRFQCSLSHAAPSDPAHPFFVEIINYRDSHADMRTLDFGEFTDIIQIAGSDKSPVTPVSISSAKRGSSMTTNLSNGARKQKAQSGKDVFCSFHGYNSSHVTEHCRVLKSQAAGGGKGPK